MLSLPTQNPWWLKAEAIESDSKIVEFLENPVKWEPRIKFVFNMEADSVYTLRGPRQVGKTTLLKLLIRDLLRRDVDPRKIFYWTCDLIEGPKGLVSIVEEFLELNRFNEERRYIFLDEISAVKNWQRGIKHLHDTGRLHNTTLILTGSHSLDIRRAAERLPGRRGKSTGPVDKVLLPMKFAEYVEARDKELERLIDDLDLRRADKRIALIEEMTKGEIPRTLDELSLYSDRLYAHFNDYLITGGVPRSINDYARYGEIRQETYSTYVQVTIGDILRWDKREIYIAQLLKRVIDTLSSQVSWRSLRKGTDIGHETTVSDYIDVLKSSFILCPLYVLDRSRRGPNYSKEKKIHFRDPFIFHALNGWVNQTPSYPETLNFLSGEGKTRLVESVVCDHLIRLAYNIYPTDEFEPTMNLMYWKSKKSEVDFVIKTNAEYIPFEVKYSSSFTRGEINGIYSLTNGYRDTNGIVITRDLMSKEKGVISIPAHIFLTLI